MAVTTCEMAGSPSGGYDGNNLQRKRKVRVAWSDIVSYEQELMPTSSVTGNQNTSGISASYPGFSGLRVTGFSWAPLAGDNSKTDEEDTYGVMKYEYAVFDITYGVPKGDTGSENPENQNPPDYDPVQLLTHSFESGGEVLTLPNTKLKWADVSPDRLLSEEAKPGIFVPTTQHSLTWPKVKRPNWTALLGYAGTINDAPFTLRGYLYPAGTLLYLGFSGEQEVMSDGVRAWKLGLKFAVKYITSNLPLPRIGQDQVTEVGWNYFVDEVTSRWQRVVGVDSGNPVYGANSFLDLFVAGP
mgnify:CR=1 FL=1